MVDYEDFLKLRRFNTPTIYNGWEQITTEDNCSCFNLEPTKDYMEEMGPMVGYAVTVTIKPSSQKYREKASELWRSYHQYVASLDGPKIVVVQDLDKPLSYGAFWGEVNSAVHLSLGCIGTITDGSIRDIDEMRGVGFKAIARGVCVGHANSVPIEYGSPVEVFGQRVEPGKFIHADKHGFLVIPESDLSQLIDAVLFMDNSECETLIKAAWKSCGSSKEAILKSIEAASETFNKNVSRKFNREGEW